MTVQALCSILIIFTCLGYWKSHGISCGLESGLPAYGILHRIPKFQIYSFSRSRDMEGVA